MTQEEILRKMTGEARLNQALKLSDLVRELAIKNIKEEHKGKISKKTLIRKLQQRLYYG